MRAGGRTRTAGLALTRRLLYQLSYSGARQMVGQIRRDCPRRGLSPNRLALVENLAQLLVLENLPLDALKRIVDRLRVAAERGGHLLVRRALEVELERVGLELRKARTEREDEALKLLCRDHADRRIVDARSRERVAERHVGVRVLPRRRVRERDVRVQRGVLEACRRLDRRDDLAGDAELGEAPERRLLVVTEVADGLVEADQPFLDQILRVAARQEVRARLQADEAGVA